MKTCNRLTLLLPGLIFFSAIASLATNTPRADDFFEILFSLILSGEAENWPDRVRAYFWQYSQHFGLFNRSLGGLIIALMGEVNFQVIVLCSCLGLPLLSYLLSRELPANTPHTIYLGLGFILCNFYVHEALLVSTGNLMILFLPVLSLACLQAARQGQLILSAILCTVATFSISSSILLTGLVGLLLLWQSWQTRSALIDRSVIGWSIFSACLLAVFLWQQNINHFNHATELYLKRDIAHPLLWGTANFLAAFASLPFDEYRDSALIPYAAILGSIHLIGCLWLTLKSWQRFPVLTLMLGLCVLSLLATCVLRVTTQGDTAFVGRYKLFLCIIIAIELIFISQLPAISATKKKLFAISCVVLGLFSYVQLYPVLQQIIEQRSLNLYRWGTTGKYEDFTLSAEILEDAYRQGIYNPFNAVDSPLHVTAVAITPQECPLDQSEIHHGISSYTRLRSIGISAEINRELHRQHGAPDAAWLCGEQHSYRIALHPTQAWDHNNKLLLFVIEKSTIADDNYQLILGFDNHHFRYQHIIDGRHHQQRRQKNDHCHPLSKALFPSVWQRYCNHPDNFSEQ